MPQRRVTSRGPVRDSPLALCDARSFTDDDLIASDLVYAHVRGETSRVAYNPAHRWYYFSDMQPDEVLFIRVHDSANDGFCRMSGAICSPQAVHRHDPSARNRQEHGKFLMTAVIHHFTHVFLLVYAGLFPIVNPIGNTPIFLTPTRHCTDRERRALALRVAINGFFLLLGSLLVGSYVLEFFGITLPVLRIAGGAVVTAFGWTLPQDGQELGNRRTAEAARGSDTGTDRH